jgi:hypothetical protein
VIVRIQGKGGEIHLTNHDYVASGGQGKVFAKNGTAFKVYHDPTHMMPEGKIRELSALPVPLFSRPHDLLLDPRSNNIIGYTTKFVDDAYVLCQLFPRSFRDREGVTHKHTFHLAELMRDGIQVAHNAGVLLVDGNEMNFLVDDKFKGLTFIDTDSYQTRSYPATAIMESVRDRHMGHARDFNEGTDWFSFAVVAFQLLVGIHPYKGKHPSLKGFDARMKANVSVFNKAVGVPASVYPFDVIPRDWRAWFEAVLDRGERVPPPGGLLQVGLIKVVVRAIKGSGNIVLEEIGAFEDDVTGVWANGLHLVVATNKSLWMDGRKIGGHGNVASVGFSPSMGVPVAVQHTQDIPELTNCVSKKGVPFGLNAQRVVSSGGSIYMKNRDRVLELSLADVGNGVIASSRRVASVLPQASLLFPGGVVQNMLGSTFVSLFSKGLSHQLRIKELDEYRVLGGKYDEGSKGGVLMVTAIKKGKTDRLAFRFDDTFASYDVRKAEDITSGDLNFVVTDAGICILLDGDHDHIELSSTRKGSTQVKTVSDGLIGGDMRLFKRGAQVLVARGNKVYTMRMS